VSRSSEVIYYEFSGVPTKSQAYTVCANAGGAWGNQRHGSAASNWNETCQTFAVGSFALMCRGGRVSTAALSAALRQWRSSEGANTKAYQLQNDALLIPFYSNSRTVFLKPGPGAPAGPVVPQLQTLPPQLIGSVPLPSGYGITGDWTGFYAGTISINWDPAQNIPLMRVSGSPPTIVPHVEPASAWVRLLAAIFPWGQLALGACVIAYAVVARAGYGRGLGNPDEAKKLRLVGAAAVALLGLALSGLPAMMPEWALQQTRQQLETSRVQAAAVERDRAALASMFRTSGGMVQPLAQSDVQRINMLTQQHRIDPVSNPQIASELFAFLSLLPFLILFVFYVPRFIAGWDWLSRKHPAEPVVAPALRTGSAINAHKLADVLTPDPRDLDLRKPAFRHKHDAEKAKALKEKLDADADLAEATIRREQKRAELKRKRAEITRLERELDER
jgi:hypothetical protein